MKRIIVYILKIYKNIYDEKKKKKKKKKKKREKIVSMSSLIKP